MGREAIVRAEVDGHAAEVKTLLEARELILRGPVRRRYAKVALQAVRVEGGTLRFESGGEAVALHLGEPMAARWAEAIRKPPPSLRDKLDLGGPVLMIGACDDPALAEALAEACTEDAAQARMIVARVDGAEDLDRALAVPGRLAIWAVYAKGKSAFGDSAIRERLRAAGYRDTKACAVSDRLTATRYQPAG